MKQKNGKNGEKHKDGRLLRHKKTKQKCQKMQLDENKKRTKVKYKVKMTTRSKYKFLMFENINKPGQIF